MTFIKPQRQAAPWSDHNWWGKYDNAANLPNTATSIIQVSSAELQEGDVAWANAPGAGGLYVCTDPTAGAAVWSPISYSGGASLQTRRDFYVDADNGSDSNPGTAADPFATIQRAVNEIPDVVNADHYIHIVEAPIAGIYDGAGLERVYNLGTGSVIIVGEGVNVLHSGTIDGGPTNRLTFTDSSQAWTDDELVGSSVRFLDGAGANHYRTIIANTATTFTIASDIDPTFPGAGDAYEIFEPTVEVQAHGVIGGSNSYSGAGYPLVFENFLTLSVGPRQSLTFANLILSSDDAAARLLQQGASVSFLGTELATGGTVFEGRLVCGTKAYSGILTMPPAADNVDEDYAAGWGIHMSGRDGTTSPTVQAGCALHGFVQRGGIAFSSFSTPSEGVCDIMSGRITGGSNFVYLAAFPGVVLRLCAFASTNRASQLIIRPLAGAASPAPAGVQINCAQLLIGNWTIIDMTGTGGDGLRVLGGQVLAVDSGAANEPTIASDAGTQAIRVFANGTFFFDDFDLSLVTVGGSNVNAVAVGPTGVAVQGTTGAGGDFTTDGDFIIGSDGSYIGREPLF